ncbi:MAG: (2Fe-2S)-binding protein [Gallicola sp.]|nr:(2Fe-2S)-binding protein [Gallicola sp.]
MSDLSIPIGFKKGAHPKYVCYCNKVTEEEIMEALDSGYTLFKNIVKRTGAMKNPNCKVNNPLGECCSLEIKKLIRETLEKKNL